MIAPGTIGHWRKRLSSRGSKIPIYCHSRRLPISTRCRHLVPSTVLFISLHFVASMCTSFLWPWHCRMGLRRAWTNMSWQCVSWHVRSTYRRISYATLSSVDSDLSSWDMWFRPSRRRWRNWLKQLVRTKQQHSDVGRGVWNRSWRSLRRTVWRRIIISHTSAKPPTQYFRCANLLADLDETWQQHNFFTSYKLANDLMQKWLTIIGTMCVNRKEIPHEKLPDRQRCYNPA